MSVYTVAVEDPEYFVVPVNDRKEVVLVVLVCSSLLAEVLDILVREGFRVLSQEVVQDLPLAQQSLVVVEQYFFLNLSS